MREAVPPAPRPGAQSAGRGTSPRGNFNQLSIRCRPSVHSLKGCNRMFLLMLNDYKPVLVWPDDRCIGGARRQIA